MKILLVISSISIGGEQRVASILSDYFVKKGHEIEIITFKKEKKKIEFNESIKITLLQSTNSIIANFSRINAIHREIKRNEYDIIIGFAIIPSILCSLASIGTASPVIICERNDPRNYKITWKIIRKIAYKFSSGAIFQTRDAQNYFQNSNVYQNSVVISNPLVNSSLPERNGDELDNRIVNTSRLVSAKNHQMLISAFSRIAERFPSFTLHIFGDGPLKQKIDNLIVELNMCNRIFLHNATPNVLNQIKNSSVFVLPSNNEGFPNSLAEAMAIGIPSISTDCRIGGPRDMINDTKNGFLVPVNDVDKLEEVLIKLLSDFTLRSKISKEAVKIRAELDVELIGDKWLQYLDHVIVSHKEDN